MQITGAMLTTRNDNWEKACSYLSSMYGYGFRPWRPTVLMVHVEGKGPRRVYESAYNGKQFIRVNKRYVPITREQHGQLIKGFLEESL